MLGTNRTSAQEQAWLTTESYDAAWWVNDYAGGANLIDMLQVEIVRGLATSNASAVEEGFATMWGNVHGGDASANWQGVVADQSFHFHGEQLLTAAYGAVWLNSVLQFYVVAAGTAYALPQAGVAVLAQYVAVGMGHVTFGRRFDYGATGRGIDRPGTTFAWGVDTDTLRALAAEPGAAPWAGELAAFADRLDGVGAPLVGNYHFWNTDFHSHHRSNWGATVKMHSNHSAAGYAVVSNECDNFGALPGVEYCGGGGWVGWRRMARK
jgi:chondroitin AC lyase